MKRWLPRSLWLLGWSGWAWLGFGLYRELPRDLGQVVCRLPVGKDELFVGVMEYPQAAVTLAKLEGTKTVVRIRDLSTGEVSKEMPGPISTREDSIPNWFSPTCGFLLTIKSSDHPVGWLSRETNYSSLDLSTGLWRGLHVTAGQPPMFHHSKPLAVFRTRREDFQLKELAIVDLRTGEQLFRWPTINDPNATGDLKFFSFIGDDKFALAFRERSETGDNTDRTRVEIWSLNNPVAPEAIHKGADVEASDSPTTSGLIAWQPNLKHPEEFKVYDVSENRLLFDNCKPHNDAWEFTGGAFNSIAPLVVDANGNSCLNPRVGMIVDLRRGTTRWQLKPLDVDHIFVEISPESMFSDRENFGVKRVESVDGVDGRGWFQVKEKWVACFRPWLRTATTYAIRDASNGALAYRLWTPLPLDGANHFKYTERRFTLDRRWLVDSDGSVHRLPPRVNWPLLAVCQTILALPLILLWAILRWRRKRKHRLARVQP